MSLGAARTRFVSYIGVKPRVRVGAAGAAIERRRALAAHDPLDAPVLIESGRSVARRARADVVVTRLRAHRDGPEPPHARRNAVPDGAPRSTHRDETAMPARGNMDRPRVGIVGASGYSGIVATRLLLAHPHAELAFCTSDKWTDDLVGARVGMPDVSRLRFVANGRALDMADGCRVVLLATSAEVSLELAPRLRAKGVSVIDLSGAFRLRDAAAYPRWYGFEHHAPSELATAHYGLPELFGPPPNQGLVANPGCYPTATILALAPLLRAGLIDPRGLVVDAKSGVTGAGRQAKEAYSFTEVADDFRAYKLLSHQHTPEIAQACGVPSLTFTAHLLPVRRGILATCYARPRGSREQLVAALKAAYEGAPFVELAAPEDVTLASVVGTNVCRIGVAANDEVVVVLAAIDNLVKGAAGQAVQNLNLMLGWDERTALAGLPRSAP
jgi:N-acetyl-gamma-glutamyl-phosphate reductase